MAGLQTNLYVGIGITWIAALVALIMRVFARRMTKVSWWFDDYFCISAFVFATGYCAILLEWTRHWSLGKLMPDDLDTESRENILYHARILGFFNSLCYASSLASSKISILSFYWRLFKTSTIRVPILVLLAMSVMWIIFRTFMLTFRCVPVQSIWDKTITGSVCNIDAGKFFLGTITTHFIMDIIILSLPIVEVSKLRLRLGQKLGIIALFILGIIVCLASAFVLVELVNYNNDTTQMPYDYAMYCILGAVEVNIAIVSACFPLLRPIFRHILPAQFLSSHGSSQPISRPSNIIRLTTLSRTNKEAEADESSSTHQLADPEQGIPDGHDFDLAPARSSGGVHTVISSREYGSESSSRDGDHGIYVRNDTLVEVEEIIDSKGRRYGSGRRS
ncbi:hypothetical protein B0J13DRAFT_239587 [Dactylonectria estremocensis]|uniref:Rhodopsin domain-containing protein n=1 Tax=Dactylonectria estremocensis TaxID=1079267 RepID=A0A9P9D897_9HYPO|nr:hypothetical protein B0J13DRAFT_239587 [Dactylonectria estremocensis]